MKHGYHIENNSKHVRHNGPVDYPSVSPRTTPYIEVWRDKKRVLAVRIDGLCVWTPNNDGPWIVVHEGGTTPLPEWSLTLTNCRAVNRLPDDWWRRRVLSKRWRVDLAYWWDCFRFFGFRKAAD